MHFRKAEMYCFAASSLREQRSSALHLHYSNPSLQKRTSPKGEVLFWRRRRDLNPRYPFGVYTISNRARSASYATSPYLAVSLCILLHLTLFVKHKFAGLQKFFLFIRQVPQRGFRSYSKGSGEAAPYIRSHPHNPSFSYRFFP